MGFDIKSLASKLTRYRQQFQVSIVELSQSTGITVESLKHYEAGSRQPSGDEILILADFYKCDFKFFISNEKLAPFEQTELLFRKHGDQLSKVDRWNIQEFLFLCECENDLIELLEKKEQLEFKFSPSGTYFKDHGKSAALELRKILGYKSDELTIDDVFRDFRRIGIHIFRRKLENSKISGLFLKHPKIGRCVLVNYSEDVYRQRFTAAHEVGHAILDLNKDFNVSFEVEDAQKIIEVRANTFASNYLLPNEMLRRKIPTSVKLNESQVINILNQLQVNPQTFAIALKNSGMITEEKSNFISSIKLPRNCKKDPELPDELSNRSKMRRCELLQLGISVYYFELCFDAYARKLISRGKLAEILLTNEQELQNVESLYHTKAI